MLHIFSIQQKPSDFVVALFVRVFEARIFFFIDSLLRYARRLRCCERERFDSVEYFIKHSIYFLTNSDTAWDIQWVAHS